MTKRPTERGGTIMSLRKAMSLVKMGAPMHPIFVHYTIALTSASLVFDALGMAFERQGSEATVAVLRHGGHILPLVTGEGESA